MFLHLHLFSSQILSYKTVVEHINSEQRVVCVCLTSKACSTGIDLVLGCMMNCILTVISVSVCLLRITINDIFLLIICPENVSLQFSI